MKVARKLDAKARAIQIAKIAEKKHVIDLTILHVGPLTSLAEFFVIGSADSNAQMQAVATALRHAFTKEEAPPRIEHSDRWLLVDYHDIILHIFRKEARAFYDLERFWTDAARIEMT